MNDPKHMELVFSKIIKPKLEKELDNLGEDFKKLIENYSWLFENDLEKTKDVFLETYFDQFDVSENSIELDYDTFYNSVSERIKQSLYEKAMDKFIHTLSEQDFSRNPVEQGEDEKDSEKKQNSTPDEELPM